MLTATLHTRTSAASQLAGRIGTGTRDQSRIAYIVSDDEQLAWNVGTAIESKGVRTHWFRSASAYLSCNRPDLASCLLISRRLSDMSGLDLQRMLACNITPPIIFLSDDGDIPSCVRAIKDGAHDFLTLPFIDSHLLAVMEAAFKKHEAALVLRREEEGLRKRWHSLTSREAEVMRYVVAGFLNKQTAYELRITENTVQVHRGRVMRKMCADSFATLVRMSLQLAERGEHALLQTPAAPCYEHAPAFISDRIAMPFAWGGFNHV